MIFAIDDEATRATIEAALGVRFEPHDSSWLGEYWLASANDVELKIRSNRDPLWKPGDPEDERFAFPEYRDHPLLLEVGGDSPDILATLRGLSGLRLLR